MASKLGRKVAANSDFFALIESQFPVRGSYLRFVGSFGHDDPTRLIYAAVLCAADRPVLRTHSGRKRLLSLHRGQLLGS